MGNYGAKLSHKRITGFSPCSIYQGLFLWAPCDPQPYRTEDCVLYPRVKPNDQAAQGEKVKPAENLGSTSHWVLLPFLCRCLDLRSLRCPTIRRKRHPHSKLPETGRLDPRAAGATSFGTSRTGNDFRLAEVRFRMRLPTPSWPNVHGMARKRWPGRIESWSERLGTG